MRKQVKGKRVLSWFLSAAMMLTLMPSMVFATENEGNHSIYVLMNIPYADFYKAELGENDAPVDAVSSATKNKPRTGTLAGGSYHKNADGTDISGVIYPVLVEDMTKLEGLTQITDESSVTIAVTNRGTTTETVYKGKDALFESADYSYYKLTEKPARYKTLEIAEDGTKSFSAVNGRATTVNDASGEVNEAGHHADVEIKLTNTSGIEQGQAVGGVVVTFEDGSKVGLRHIAELWRATEIGGSAVQFADKKITNVRYYLQNNVIDFPMEIVIKKKAASVTAEFTDVNTIQITGLPDDLENTKATVQTKVGRGQTPTVIAENVDVKDGIIATTFEAEKSKTYTVTISSDNYLRISADAESPRSEGEEFLSQLIGDYQPLFEGATLNSEYDHYWHDYAAAVVGESSADDTVAHLKGSINAEGYGENNDASNFYCGFVNDVATISFGSEDGKTVTFTREDGSSVTHTYEFVKEAAAKGNYEGYEMVMDGYLYQALEEPADEFQYLLMFPDTPDTTYHLEFRYAASEEDVLNLLDGPYAYWVGSAIQTSALTEEDEDTLQKVISLFVVENLAGNETEETDTQRKELVGTWDCDFSAFPEYGNAKMHIVLSADGTGKTFADFTGSGEPSLTAEYTFYAYDPDKADGKNAGTYIALNPVVETVTPGEYEVKRIDGKKALVFTSNEGVITYYHRDQSQDDNSESGGGGSVTPTYKVAIPDTTSGGSVSTNPSKAKKGDTVTITVNPDDGYQPDEVIVKDKAGNEIEVKDNGDGTYTFTMPSSEVTVEAAFKEKEAEPQPEPTVPDMHDNCPSGPFKDVDTSLWYHEGIDYVIENGMMNGVASDAFAPDDTTTRAMIVTILYRLEGEPAAEASSFKDVETSSWYEAAVNWAATNGIVNGYDAGTFAPTDEITREQMAAILYRYAIFKAQDVSGQTDLTSFTDSSAVSEWAENAMAWTVSAELINGMTDTTLVPQGSATRAQVATLMMRLCENVLK